MKKMKKILTILLTLAMVMGMATSAFAAPDEAPTDGSITIRNATADKDYTAYKVFDLTYGEPQTFDPDGLATSPVAYSYTPTGDDDAFLEALQGDDSPFELAEVKDGTGTVTSYGVTLKDGCDVEDVTEFLKAQHEAGNLQVALDKDGVAATATGTASDDEIVFDNLPYGYYFVTSGLGSEVTIDSTMKDVTIVDKNEQPTVPEDPEEDPDYPDDPDDQDPTDPEHPSPYKAYPGKAIVNPDGTLDEDGVNDANYGDFVHFGYSVNATAYADPTTDGQNDTDNYSTDPDVNGEQNKFELVTYYYIEDIMGQGFDLVKADSEWDDVEAVAAVTDSEGNVTNVASFTKDDETVATEMIVRVIKEDGTTVVLTEGEDYEIKYTADENDGFEDEGFQITIPWGEKYGANATITLDYYARVTEKAIIAADGNPNTANFSYETDPDFDPDNEMVPNPEYNPYSDPDNDLYDPDSDEYDEDKDPSVNPEYEVPDPEIPSKTPDPDEDPADYNDPYDPSNPDDPEYPDNSYNNNDNFDPEDDTDNPTYDPFTARSTETDVFAIAIIKVDETGAPLATAKFTLERKTDELDENDEPIWVPVYVTTLDADAAEEEDPDGVYAFDYYSDAAAADDSNVDLVTPTTTNEKGEIIVKGLAAGTYRFTEIQAPAGYNLPAEPFELTATDDRDANTDELVDYSYEHVSYFDADGLLVEEEDAEGTSLTTTFDELVKATTIQNLTGTELPSTGGMGTTIIYIVGAILILGAAVLLITRRRMSSEA